MRGMSSVGFGWQHDLFSARQPRKSITRVTGEDERGEVTVTKDQSHDRKVGELRQLLCASQSGRAVAAPEKAQAVRMRFSKSPRPGKPQPSQYRCPRYCP